MISNNNKRVVIPLSMQKHNMLNLFTARNNKHICLHYLITQRGHLWEKASLSPRAEGMGLPLLRATGEVPQAEQFTDHPAI